jgi:DNA modification methylase
MAIQQPSLFIPTANLPLADELESYRTGRDTTPRFFQGDSLEVLQQMPNAFVDCCVTSPPYWGHREYDSLGIGLEVDYQDYVRNLVVSRSYFYDVDQIRNKPREAKVSAGKVVSATGVSGVRYKRQLELSMSLSDEEKQLAFKALENILHDVELGKLSDFRMVIRGQQRSTHSDQSRVSGRERELEQKGFYFLKYHPNGAKPGDVWDIMPEDTQRRESHFAPYPEDLCRIPIRVSCPSDGIVLDPFCGTGTTMRVASSLGRKSIGIDLSEKYLETARKRCGLYE